MPDKAGRLQFTVDYPSLYVELLENNAESLGGSLFGLRLVLLGLKQIGQIAIEENNLRILEVLKILGIVED